MALIIITVSSWQIRDKVELRKVDDSKEAFAKERDRRTIHLCQTGANVAVIGSALNPNEVKTTLTVYARANSDAELAARRTAHDTMLASGKKKKSTGLVAYKKASKTTGSNRESD